MQGCEITGIVARHCAPRNARLAGGSRQPLHHSTTEGQDLRFDVHCTELCADIFSTAALATDHSDLLSSRPTTPGSEGGNCILQPISHLNCNICKAFTFEISRHKTAIDRTRTCTITIGTSLGRACIRSHALRAGTRMLI